ncbi:12216_t:CDS:2, partial [Racocetra persica]
ETIREVLPGIYTYSIMVGEDESEDKKSSFFGNINEEVNSVCEKLKADINLKYGFNAIGFSQRGRTPTPFQAMLLGEGHA